MNAFAEQAARLAIEGWFRAAGRPRVEMLLESMYTPASEARVFRLSTAKPCGAPRQLVAKVYGDLIGRTVHRAQAVLHARLLSDGEALRVPAVLGFDEDRQVMLQSFATGRTLSTFAPDGSVIDALHRTGTALAQLHSLPLTALALADAPGRDACGFEAQMRGLMRPHPNELCERCPALSARIKRVLAELREWAASVASPVAPLHRDFHPRQIFIGDSVVEVVDWDLHGAGDPALDLASLHLHIEWRWPTIAAAGQAAFLRGYGAERVQAFAGRIALYRAFHHLRRACKAYRLRGLVAMSEIDANLRAADPAIACAHGTSGMPA